MVDFDGGIESKFCGIVDADVGIKPTELAARDCRVELYTRYAFDIGDASELLAQVMSDYCLDPDQMIDVVKLGEQALRSGLTMAEHDYKRITEKVALVAGVLQPLMTVPQAWKVYTTQSVSGLSIITWAGYCILGLAFLAYGLVHDLKPVWITQILWFTLQMSIVIGILVYG